MTRFRTFAFEGPELGGNSGHVEEEALMASFSQERSFKILLKCAKLLLDLRIDSEPRWT